MLHVLLLCVVCCAVLCLCSWQYINNNNLKGPGGVVRCDGLLRDAFGKDQIKHTEIMGLISKHLQK